jgi:hypothetical protein
MLENKIIVEQLLKFDISFRIKTKHVNSHVKIE